jgi:hypothetical protein
MAICNRYADWRNLVRASASLDVDGHFEWPDPNVRTFVPFTSWQFAHGVTLDLDAGSSNVHWYLSLPNEGTSAARWYLYSATTPTPDSVQLYRTAAGSAEQADLIGNHGYNLQQVRQRQLRNVCVYAYDVTNDVFYGCDLFRAAFAPETL